VVASRSAGDEVSVPPAKRPRVTLRDVAEQAGVSMTTASFVMSGRRDMRISAATQERVLQAARTLDYHRRLLPKSQMPSGAPAIGLISDVVATESFAGEMLRGAIAAATERGHVLLMADSLGVADIEASAVRSLMSRGVERFVYATNATEIRTLPESLRSARLVLLNNTAPGLELPAVIPNDAQAGRTAATALADAGHTDGIWLVGKVIPEGVAARRRLGGIKAGLRAAGLRLAGHVQCEWWPGAARSALLRQAEAGWWQARPTAVIAMNDRIAMGVYQAAAAAGRRVPEDLSVISFDNSDVARWLDPALSSLALPHFDLGRRAVELLLDDDPPHRTQRLPMPLRSRASVASPPSRRDRGLTGPSASLRTH
jgi:LacI family transcriptional regulator